MKFIITILLINETSSTSYVAFNLESSSQYCFKIKAKDAAGNTSEFSNEVCENTLDSGGNPEDCMSESFDNLQSEVVAIQTEYGLVI